MLALGAAVGVRGGSGTEQDPYRIEDWFIDVANWSATGSFPAAGVIDIQGTTKHILIQDNQLPRAVPAGISLTNVRNVRVESNRVTAGFTENTGENPTVDGIVVVGGSSVTIRSNEIFDVFGHYKNWNGVRAVSVDGLLVEANVLRTEAFYGERVVGVHVSNSTAVTVRGNDLDGPGHVRDRFGGVHLYDVTAARVEDNDVTGPGDGRGRCLHAERTVDAAFVRNRVQGCNWGVVLRGDHRSVLDANTVQTGTIGLLWQDSLGGGFARGNTFSNFARPFNVTGANALAYAHTVTADNLVGGGPVLYARGLVGAVVDGTGYKLAYVVSSRGVEVRNVVASGQVVGLTLVDVAAAWIHDVDVSDRNELGARVLASHDLRIDRFRGGQLRVESTHGLVVADSTMAGARYGVRLVSSTDGTVLDHVRVERNHVGIEIENGNTNRITGSDIRDNSIGVRLLYPAFARIDASSIAGNTVSPYATGLWHDGTGVPLSRADVAGNWWGHAGGPTVGGVAAGDRIYRGPAASTTWGPWLTSPPAGVGPR